MSNYSAGTYNRKTLDVKAVHSNLQQEIIQITEDKLRLVMNDHISELEQRKGWVAPLGILFTILVVFSTTSFKKAYFEASTWEAFFLMAGFLTFLWLCKSIYLAFNTCSVDDIVCIIKNSLTGNENS